MNRTSNCNFMTQGPHGKCITPSAGTESKALRLQTRLQSRPVYHSGKGWCTFQRLTLVLANEGRGHRLLNIHLRHSHGNVCVFVVKSASVVDHSFVDKLAFVWRVSYNFVAGNVKISIWAFVCFWRSLCLLMHHLLNKQKL